MTAGNVLADRVTARQQATAQAAADAEARRVAEAAEAAHRAERQTAAEAQAAQERAEEADRRRLAAAEARRPREEAQRRQAAHAKAVRDHDAAVGRLRDLARLLIDRPDLVDAAVAVLRMAADFSPDDAWTAMSRQDQSRLIGDVITGVMTEHGIGDPRLERLEALPTADQQLLADFERIHGPRDVEGLPDATAAGLPGALLAWVPAAARGPIAAMTDRTAALKALHTYSGRDGRNNLEFHKSGGYLPW